MSSPIFFAILFFSIVYLGFLCVTLWVNGFERFWNRKVVQHRFDFVNIISLVVVEFLYMFFFRTVALEKAIVLLSMARMLRLCRYIKPLKQLFSMLKRLWPTYMAIF